MIYLGSRHIACCKLAPTLARQTWRHNYVTNRNKYLIFTLSESVNPLVYSLQFLFKSTNNSWRYETKCEWVFFSEHSVVYRRRFSQPISWLVKKYTQNKHTYNQEQHKQESRAVARKPCVAECYLTDPCLQRRQRRRTSPQHRQLSPVNMSAQSVDAGEQQRSAWCPIWELTSSTDQRLICLSRQETPSLHLECRDNAVGAVWCFFAAQ